MGRGFFSAPRPWWKELQNVCWCVNVPLPVCVCVLLCHSVCVRTSLMAVFSSSPRGRGRFPVSFMARPKSLITHVPSPFTRTFRLFRSLCEIAGLYTSADQHSRGER